MQDKIEIRAFIAMLVLVSLAFIWVLLPFWVAIFWAAAMAVVFYPLQRRLQHKFPNSPNLNTLLTLSCGVVIVVIPVLFIAFSFIQEGVMLYQKIDSGELDPSQFMEKIRSAFPVIPETLEHLGVDTENVRQQVSNFAVSASRNLAQQALAVGQNAFAFVINVGLMLYLTFFLLRDGSQLTRLMVRALPLGDEREHELFQKFTEVTRATIKGNIVVAMVQGALGGLILWWLGIPAAVMWGVVMAFLSLIPAIGAGLVWLPVALYLYATGDWLSGSILIAYGALVIGIADNVLRPMLVGRDTKLPDYIVLFSTLGGIALIGIHGFVVGPLVAALFMVFWDIFMREINVASSD